MNKRKDNVYVYALQESLFFGAMAFLAVGVIALAIFGVIVRLGSL